MKCPSCGQGFHGVNTASSFNLTSQNSTQHPSSLHGGNAVNNATQQQNQTQPTSIRNNLIAPFASFWMRFLAALIDACIIIVPAMILGGLIGSWGMMWDDSDSITTLKIQAVSLLFGILYEAIFLSSGWMATPGKRLMGIKVTDLSGNPISFWRGAGRSAGKLISSILFIGYIMAAFTKNKQALHDLMASTFVIKG
jgi:uncharacterized RDD family membrane protein YckC